MSKSENYFPKILRVKQEKSKYAFLMEIIPALAAVIAISSIIVSNCNVSRSLELQSEQKAMEIYEKYDLMAKESQDFTDTIFASKPENWTAKYVAFAKKALFYSESIFILRRDSQPWLSTVELSLLLPHLTFYKKNNFLDETFNEDFKKFVERLYKRYKVY